MIDKRGLFGPGEFYKSTLAIDVPIMLQQLIQSLVSLVDNFMVSGLGDVCIASSMRDLGNVRTPMVITVIATLTNTLFNWLLIYGRFGFPRLGVEGAAWATVIARAVEFAAFAAVYVRQGPVFAIKPANAFEIDGALFREILKRSLLVLFCEMVWVFSETITTAVYNGRGGADVVSGMASSFAIANLYFVAFGGVYSATGVILGKTLGEGNLEKAREEKTWLLSGSAVFGFAMTGFGLLTTLIVPLVFGRLSDSAIGICRSMVAMMSLFMPVWVYMNTQQAVARAGGDTKMGAYSDAGLTLCVMLPLVFLLARFTNVGPVALYCGVSPCVICVAPPANAVICSKSPLWRRRRAIGGIAGDRAIEPGLCAEPAFTVRWRFTPVSSSPASRTGLSAPRAC